LIATGLRAAANALSEMFTQQFADQATLNKPLGDLGDKLDALDTTHDAANRQVVAQSVQLIGQIIRQMNETLTQRLQQATPSTGPTTQP